MSGTDLLVFRLGRRLFALNPGEAREVFHPVGVTPAPMAPPVIVGVMNLRGRIVTLICARRLLRIASSKVQGPKPIAIGLDIDGDSYGLIVDEVEGVCRADPGPVMPPHDLPGNWAAHSSGIRKAGGRELVALDVRRLIEAVTEAA